MILTFYKYQGTGNDFVMIDNRQQTFSKNDAKTIAFLCDRRFGIGADGLILLENDPLLDFKMVYYNSDGNESTMCGNGGRCIVAFAKFLGIMDQETTFNAVDGKHYATIKDDIVSLQMLDVQEIKEKEGKYLFLDTGSPHHVQKVQNLKAYPVVKEGAKLRYGMYGEAGSNINFVEKNEDGSFALRTYERGVEDETLACGTGATAAAIAMHKTKETTLEKVKLQVLGGELEVSFKASDAGYKDVFLKGPAKLVFKGEIAC